jgi:cobalt-zinc-cadmium resistance protein CzcA
VLKRINENTKQVIDRIKEKVTEINKALPAGVQIVDFYDQAELVDNSVFTVVESLIEGEALVLIILVLLLGNFRSSFITAAAIPFCMLVAFILMWYFGQSANLMSLGGLAISIGMMVDATVVMVENVYRHLEEHREHSTREAILVAAQEIGRPMFFAILIIIAVFLPVFTLQGIEGKLFKPLAYAVTFSMIGSMAMALCIAPMLCALWLRLRKAKRVPIQSFDSLKEFMFRPSSGPSVIVTLHSRSPRSCWYGVSQIFSSLAASSCPQSTKATCSSARRCRQVFRFLGP